MTREKERGTELGREGRAHEHGPTSVSTADSASGCSPEA